MTDFILEQESVNMTTQWHKKIKAEALVTLTALMSGRLFLLGQTPAFQEGGCLMAWNRQPRISLLTG